MTHETITAQVSALAASRVAQPADDPMSAFATERAQLAAAATPEGVIAPGSILPDAPLLDPNGAATTLYDALPGDRPAVLVFYRGAWCPFCNIALRTYQQALLPELDRRGVALVAISPQAPDGSLTMQEKNDLTFTVLSDPGLRLARSVGIETAPLEEARAAQLQLGLDLTVVNADGTTGIPIPTTLILDADHAVRWVDLHPDYSTRSEPGEILAALDALGPER